MRYFCNQCGYAFETSTPERDSIGLLNDIWCPACGCYDIYTDDHSGRFESLYNFMDEDNEAIEVDIK